MLPVLARAIQVRLRMVAVFVVAFLVVGNWETLSNYWDRLTTFATNASPQAVSANTEYFCPMCPGVISDWPSKCPVRNMALVRRKKGGPVQLPDGVVSQMQYSRQRSPVGVSRPRLPAGDRNVRGSSSERIAIVPMDFTQSARRARLFARATLRDAK
jgi:hypothetical protein